MTEKSAEMSLGAADKSVRATAKKKWFQVTQLAARSPTGMHGQNMACDATGISVSCSPLPLLHGLGSMLQTSSAYAPLETAVSERTFARPQ
jgi:hypothetical protein